jgi:hypothetical protein
MIAIKEQFLTDSSGITTGVLIPKKDYDKLVEYIEDLEDIAACEKAKASAGSATIRWKNIRRSK